MVIKSAIFFLKKVEKNLRHPMPLIILLEVDAISRIYVERLIFS